MKKSLILLSLIIPVFNEQDTIVQILKKIDGVNLINNIQKQILIVDDGSTDATEKKIIQTLSKLKTRDIRLLKHSINQGKGAAIKTALEYAFGEYVIIQDADLEYNPEQINILIEKLMTTNTEVVYGTRLNRLPHLSNEERNGRFLLHYLGNRLLSLLTSMLYGQWLTDMETCYKLIPTKAIRSITLNAKGFEFEPEITVKLMKQGYRIMEVPITTIPRNYSEGKKLNTFKDGITALKTLLYYRFIK